MFFISKIDFFIVSGSSMDPTLKNGDYVIAYQSDFKVGDIVVINSSGICNSSRIIKRITAIDGEMVFVEGDNKENSYDSRNFGWIDKKLIIGTVIYHHADIV